MEKHREFLYIQSMDHADKIAALEREVRKLKARCDDLLAAFKQDTLRTTHHINKLYGRTADTRECLEPALRKLFPGIARDNAQIVDVLRRRPSSGSKSS